MKRNTLISAAASNDGQIITGLWGGEVTISASAGTDGGGAAKLDVPDSKGGKMEPGARGEKIDGKDDKAPLPRFSLSAYNGGPMRLAGFQFPVVIEASGVKFATEKLPVYVGHPAEDAPASEMMEALVGQAECSVKDGRITACGAITGNSATVQQMMTHAKNGFQFQNSVHGRPVEMSFIKAGETATINGQSVTGPANVARQSVLDHIAILPLGADTSTSARIAARHAAGDKQMEKFAWIKANYGMDEAAFNALPETARTTIAAAFEAASKAKEPEKKEAAISAGGAIADTDAVIKAQNAAVADNRKRIAGIDAIDGASDFPAITAQAVSENWSVEKAENAIIKAQRDRLTQESLRPVRGISTEMKAAYPRVIEAAVLMSCGYRGDLTQDRRYGEKIANMTDDFFHSERSRVMTPSKIARIVARHNGASLPDGHGDDFWSEALANERVCPRGGERLISAEFSSLSLPVALSNVMNKFILMGYNQVDPNACDPTGPQAWRHVCKVSSVQDFKPHYRIRMVASLMLKRLLKGGEIQHGSVGEQSYMLTADTKAIMLGITRRDLINDDMSVMSTMPTHFGIGAGQTVANDIWDALLADYQSDGSTAFFTASAVTTVGNKMALNLTTGASLSFANAEAAYLRLGAQTRPDGQPAGLLGRVLLVPTALALTAKQINISERIPVYATSRANGVGDANTMRGVLAPVASAYLQNGTVYASDGTTARSGSATTWYVTTGAQDSAYPIEIGFLNGTEAPIIERAEADFSRLGIGFRTFLDYGIALSEPRAAQKQTA
jgi:hypothetical protein